MNLCIAERLHEIEQNQELINAKLDKLIEIFNTKVSI